MAKKRDAILHEYEDELPVDLSPAELLDRGLKLAKCEDSLADVRGAFDKARAVLKADEKQISEERARLARVVREGREMRMVPVRDVAKYAEGLMVTQRVDTGATVRQRALSDAERQDQLPGMPKGKAAHGAPGHPAESKPRCEEIRAGARCRLDMGHPGNHSFRNPHVENNEESEPLYGGDEEEQANGEEGQEGD